MKAKEQKQEHTSSYYAATVNRITDYPALQGEHSADVCVVGAGFTGVSTALTLAERGYSVALVEANRVGWGASGRNGGQLIHGFTSDSKIEAQVGKHLENVIYDMIWRGHDIIQERVEKYGIECDLKNGFIEVATKPRHMAYFESQQAKLQRHNHPYEYRMLDKAETQDTLGTDAYSGAFLTMRNGHLHPLNLCIGEATAAEKLGARIFEQSPVTGIEHGARPRVVTEDGYVEAESVVLAGNAYHRLESRHLSGLTFPAGSYIIGTEPLSADLIEEINPMDLAVCDSNEIVDYFRLSADGRMLYGGRCNYSGRDPGSIEAAIRPRMLKIYPQLRDARIDFEWGGKIGIVLNRVPLIGRINGNVYYAQGYSGHGVNASHVMGEVVAEAIAGTMERFDVFANNRHIRVPGTRWFGNQMLALGMLYYRIKDGLF